LFSGVLPAHCAVETAQRSISNSGAPANSSGVEHAGVEIGAATTFFLTAVTPLK
jgi:hypothetical protein